MDVGLQLVLALAFLLTGLYGVGAVWNRRLQRRLWSSLSDALKPLARRWSFKSLGTSGFKVATRLGSGPMSKLEVDVILLARELPLYAPIAFALGRRDRLLVKANFRGKPSFRLELFGRSVGKREKEPKGLSRVDVGAVSTYFSVFSNSPDEARAVLLEGDVLEGLISMRAYIERVSVAPEEPNMIIVAHARPDTMRPGVELAVNMAHAFMRARPEPGARGRRGRGR